MTPPNPADLHSQTVDALDQLRDLRRTVLDLTNAYVRLDAAHCDVDTLGDPLDVDTAVTRTQDALADVQRALTLADDAFDVAMRTTSRLRISGGNEGGHA